MKDLEALTAECRKHDISVCLDFVMNHTDEDHPWAKAARASDEEARKRYFFFDNWDIPSAFEYTVPEVCPTAAPGNFTQLDSGDIVMTTYSLPLKDKQGKTYAVLTADLPLDWVHSTREKLDSIINVDMNMTSDSICHCYSFIIGRDGTFISHPDKAYAMKENIFTMAKQAQAKDMEDLATLMTKGEEGTSVIRLKNQIQCGKKLIPGISFSRCSQSSRR